jgi:hypothetical protein
MSPDHIVGSVHVTKVVDGRMYVVAGPKQAQQDHTMDPDGWRPFLAGPYREVPLDELIARIGVVRNEVPGSGPSWR